MPRKLTSAASLHNLRKEARRWLKALGANDSEARARLLRAYPNAPERPVLRDVQHALAREYGAESWIAMKQSLAAVGAGSTGRFLEWACPDHHVRGLPAHRMARHAAMRILEANPALACESIYTAVVCGEIGEVERRLRERPELANARRAAAGPGRSGPGGNVDFLGDKDWTPLVFLCFTRLALAQANDNAVAIAKLLLDRGADPNAHFMAGDSRYTPLVGAIGEGEEGRPPHPYRDELVRLLLERGAEPYDIQVIYNIHFHGHVLWWLKLMYEFSVKAGRRADWDDPEWKMIAMGSYGSGAQWHLGIAIEKNDIELADWCLTHGADARTASFEDAVRLGRTEIAELLVRHGAERREVALPDEDRYVAACRRLDRAEVQRILAAHPEFLQSPKAMFAAAREDRADVAALLLDLGTPLEAEDKKKQRALHVAARSDAVHVAALLIERGAEVDPYELNHNNTPLDFAVYYENARMIDLLCPHSRDVWNLAFLGDVERLRQVLSADPRLAQVTWRTTPLFWLPEDEDKAIEIAKLFIKNGADAAFASKKDGSTAAEVAHKRGMRRVAALLEEAGGAVPAAARRQNLIRDLEQAARDLVSVYESDDADALDHLGRLFNRFAQFEQVRAFVKNRVAGAGATLALHDARDLIARQSGFENWAALIGPPSAPAVSAANRHNEHD